MAEVLTFDPSKQVSPLTAITPPEPVVDTGEEHHYINTVPNASIHRKDGTRIGFVFGHFKTTMKADIEFLENEIAGGHPTIRHAKADEIRDAMMKKDPVGTIRAEVREEERSKMELELREKIMRELGLDKTVASADLTQQQSGTDKSSDAGKIAGTSPGNSAIERLRAQSASLTMIPTPALRPVSSADMAGTASDSNSK